MRWFLPLHRISVAVCLPPPSIISSHFSSQCCQSPLKALPAWTLPALQPGPPQNSEHFLFKRVERGKGKMVRAFSLNVLLICERKKCFTEDLAFLYSPARQKLSYPAWSSSPMKEHGYSTLRGQAAGEVCAAAELYCWFQSLRVWSEDALR